jgi:hypothetical protein
MGNEGVFTITSINCTLVDDAIGGANASDYVFTITSINGTDTTVIDACAIVGISSNASDYVVTIASINKVMSAEAPAVIGNTITIMDVTTRTSNCVIAIASIYRYADEEAEAWRNATAIYYVVTLPGIPESFTTSRLFIMSLPFPVSM